MVFTPGFLRAYGGLDFKIGGPQRGPRAPYLGGAGASIRLTAITARQARSLDSAALTAKLLEEVHAFATDVVEELKKYPPPVHNIYKYMRKADVKAISSGRASILPQAFEWPRSYNLQRHWRVRPYTRGDARGYDIVNDAREGQRNIQYGPRAHGRALNRYYARYVQGPPHTYAASADTGLFEHGGQQTWFHGEHGWTTTVDAVERFGGRKVLKSILQDIINDHLAEAGLR